MNFFTRSSPDPPVELWMLVHGDDIIASFYCACTFCVVYCVAPPWRIRDESSWQERREEERVNSRRRGKGNDFIIPAQILQVKTNTAISQCCSQHATMFLVRELQVVQLQQLMVSQEAVTGRTWRTIKFYWLQTVSYF